MKTESKDIWQDRREWVSMKEQNKEMKELLNSLNLSIEAVKAKIKRL